MSTESGKTCEKCRPELKAYHELSSGKIILCHLHDGSMVEKLAKALGEFIDTITGRGTAGAVDAQRLEKGVDSALELLAAYDELQGRKGCK